MAQLELYKRPGGSGLVVEEALLFRQAISYMVGAAYLSESITLLIILYSNSNSKSGLKTRLQCFPRPIYESAVRCRRAVVYKGIYKDVK